MTAKMPQPGSLRRRFLRGVLAGWTANEVGEWLEMNPKHQHVLSNQLRAAGWDVPKLLGRRRTYDWPKVVAVYDAAPSGERGRIAIERFGFPSLKSVQVGICRYRQHLDREAKAQQGGDPTMQGAERG